LIATQRRKIRI